MAVPERLRERLRMLVARWNETRLRRSSRTRGAALVFHAVAARAGDPELEIEPAVAAERLDAAVAYLARRYALVRAEDLPAVARKRRRGERIPVAVTFDDDLRSHRDHAAPVFRRHGAVATAFLCGAREPFWWQLLQVAIDTRAIAADGLAGVPRDLVEGALARRPRAIGRLAKAIEDLDPNERDGVRAALRAAVPTAEPMLGSDDAAVLEAAGWEIGFHTLRHDALPGLGGPELRKALQAGRDQRPAAPPRTLAYPHGKAGLRESRAVCAAGYVAAYTGRAEVFTEQTDVHLIGRLQPDPATLGRFALQLARALVDP